MLGSDRRWLNLLGLRPTGDFGALTIYTSHRGKTVFFPRAPPTKPPTTWQRRQRNLFRHCAAIWSDTPGARRAQWRALAADNHLSITAYNLFVYYHLTGDEASIATLHPSWGPPY